MKWLMELLIGLQLFFLLVWVIWFEIKCWGTRAKQEDKEVFLESIKEGW